jgi:phospholipid-binding lipoprotein MlaA
MRPMVNLPCVHPSALASTCSGCGVGVFPGAGCGARAGYTALLRTLAACAVAFLVASCATIPDSRDRDYGDPFEHTNRIVFNANSAVDDAVGKPLAEAYRTMFPPFVRDRIRSFIDNLTEPRVLLNDMLQMRVNAAGITLSRFLINSTFGLGGLFDVAGDNGLPRQTGDFGETLYVWGVGSGPYLVLPLVGPSNVRDAFGLAVDLYTTPPAHLIPGTTGLYVTIGTYAVAGIDLRARNIETLDQIKAGAIDYYAQLGSLARQHRDAQLRAARGVADQPQELVDPGESPE